MAAIKGMHPTLTKKGFDMGKLGFNHDKWVKSYDGSIIIQHTLQFIYVQ